MIPGATGRRAPLKILFLSPSSSTTFMLYVGHAHWHFLRDVAMPLYTYPGFGVCFLTIHPALPYWCCSNLRITLNCCCGGSRKGKGLGCSHVGGQGARGSWGLLVGPYYNSGKSNESIVKNVIVAVYKVLHSEDLRKFSFLNVLSCPTMISEDPTQQWLAGSDPMYPGGTQQILCEPHNTHS